MMSKRWVWTGGAVYLLAWLLPVVEDGTTLPEGGVPGWEALRFALATIWPVAGVRSDHALGAILSTLSGLTNALVPVALVQFARNARPAARRLGWALLIAALVNASWLVLGGDPGGLRLGYYLWLASFVVLAAAGFRIARVDTVAAATPATA